MENNKLFALKDVNRPGTSTSVITMGNEYEVINITPTAFYIIDDSGNSYGFANEMKKRLFSNDADILFFPMWSRVVKEIPLREYADRNNLNPLVLRGMKDLILSYLNQNFESPVRKVQQDLKGKGN